jgi:hypothetical protein
VRGDTAAVDSIGYQMRDLMWHCVLNLLIRVRHKQVDVDADSPFAEVSVSGGMASKVERNERGWQLEFEMLVCNSDALCGFGSRESFEFRWQQHKKVPLTVEKVETLYCGFDGIKSAIWKSILTPGRSEFPGLGKVLQADLLVSGLECNTCGIEVKLA